MAACNFSIPFSGQSSAIIEKAREAILKQNGNFKGDDSFGTFNVSVFGNTIKGGYSVAGQSLNIVIEEKPILLSCSMLESFLKGKIA